MKRAAFLKSKRENIKVSKEENDRHPNATILLGDISPDGNCKVSAIKNDGITLAFGLGDQYYYSNMSEVSFSDCELLWGV